MLTLFLEFLSAISANLAEHLVAHEQDNATFRAVFDIYILLRRTADNLEGFSRRLALWQRQRYHGSVWSCCQGDIDLANHVLHLLDRDLTTLILTQPMADREILRSKFRGWQELWKFDVFDIWLGLIKQNATEHFCGWLSNTGGSEWQKTIFIPSYSLLLPSVQRASELADITQSCWGHYFHFDIFELEDSGRASLAYLPELPPAFPITQERYNSLGKPSYALAIVVPAQEPTMTELIETSQRSAAAFRSTISPLRDVLMAQANNDPARFFKAWP